jgi:hypothetical protein
MLFFPQFLDLPGSRLPRVSPQQIKYAFLIFAIPHAYPIAASVFPLRTVQQTKTI